MVEDGVVAVKEELVEKFGHEENNTGGTSRTGDSFSISSYLKAQFEEAPTELDNTTHSLFKQERIYNFLHVPYKLEKVQHLLCSVLTLLAYSSYCLVLQFASIAFSITFPFYPFESFCRSRVPPSI